MECKFPYSKIRRLKHPTFFFPFIALIFSLFLPPGPSLIAKAVFFLLFPWLIRWIIINNVRIKPLAGKIFISLFFICGSMIAYFRILFSSVDDPRILLPYAVVPIATLLAFRGRFLRRLPFFCLVFTSFSISFMYLMFFFTPHTQILDFAVRENEKWDHLEAVISQPDVRTLIHIDQLDDKPVIKYENGLYLPLEYFDPYMIWCDPGKALYISYEDRHIIERIDLVTGKRSELKTPWMVTFFDVTPDKKIGLAGPWYTEDDPVWMFEFELNTLKITRKIDFPYDGSYSFEDIFRIAHRIDPERRFIQTIGGRIYIVDNQYKVQKSWGLPSIHTVSSIYVPKHEMFYMFSLPFYLQIDTRSFHLKNFRFFITGYWSAYIEEKDEILVNNFWDMHVLNPITLKTKRKIRIGPGCRMFALDHRRGWIYIAKYYPGSILAVEYATGRKIGEFKTGNFTRAVHYCEKSDKIYAGSTVGVFEFSPSDFKFSTESAGSSDALKVP